VTILVRPEEPADAAAVQRVIAAAFRTVDGTVDGKVDGKVAEVGLNEALRRDPAWIADLCLVAVRDGRVVGQLTSSNGTLTDPAGGRRRVVGVGPVSVHPDEQGAGVGRTLLTTLIDRARQAGESALVLPGRSGLLWPVRLSPGRRRRDRRAGSGLGRALHGAGATGRAAGRRKLPLRRAVRRVLTGSPGGRLRHPRRPAARPPAAPPKGPRTRGGAARGD